MSQRIIKGEEDVKNLTFQEIIFDFAILKWPGLYAGCRLMIMKKGCGNHESLHSSCHCPEPWNAAYVEPSRRPDGRYGETPNRLYQHHHPKVAMNHHHQIFKNSTWVIENRSTLEHDIRFVEDNWKTHQLVQLVLVGKLVGRYGNHQFTYFNKLWIGNWSGNSEVTTDWNVWLHPRRFCLRYWVGSRR